MARKRGEGQKGANCKGMGRADGEKGLQACKLAAWFQRASGTRRPWEKQTVVGETPIRRAAVYEDTDGPKGAEGRGQTRDRHRRGNRGVGGRKSASRGSGGGGQSCKKKARAREGYRKPRPPGREGHGMKLSIKARSGVWTDGLDRRGGKKLRVWRITPFGSSAQGSGLTSRGGGG